jgi:hypothetical protein
MSEDTAGTALARAGGILSGAEARPWAVPAVGRPGGGPLTAGRLETIEEEARESGRAAGHKEGYAAGQAEVMRRAEQLDRILAGLADPVSHLDAEVEQELLEMVMAIARRLIRRELKTNPGEIIGVVREGIASLPVGERKVTLQLHPEGRRPCQGRVRHERERPGLSHPGRSFFDPWRGEDLDGHLRHRRDAGDTHQPGVRPHARRRAPGRRGGCRMTQSVPVPTPELRRAALRSSLARRRRRVQQAEPMIAEGRLVRMVGLTLEAVGCEAPVGSRCIIVGGGGAQTEAEVVGFAGERVFLMPVGDIHGLTPGARVRPLSGSRNTPVGEALLGRVVDGSGRPLDGRGPVESDAWMPLRGQAVNPLSRAPLEQPLDVGIRATQWPVVDGARPTYRSLRGQRGRVRACCWA